MRILKEVTHFDFLGKKLYALIVSIILILMGIVSVIYHQGLNYGIDFKGGFQVRIKFEQTIDLNELRTQFDRLEMTSTSLQTIGDSNEVKLVLPLDNPLGTGSELTGNLNELLASD